MINRQLTLTMPKMPFAGHIRAIPCALQLGRNRLDAGFQ
eukprot:CAMPEP_0197234082 /NCGR_PEP_ID=MMETSP1429-20130617/1922_1 /TAXON_ID=49237 /ORGANISM="Chaetoceros  sp., Strain UNC1202" /LENGTH=38 /DNA_ID=CAMNT_0042692409 /DNA_START=207 /DNA_END=320 /DNA_ORIENTATION=+